MVSPIFIPPKIKSVQKCDRCGLLFSLEDKQCKHCSNLNEKELARFLEKKELEEEGIRKLGIYMGGAFLFFVALIVYFML